MQRHFSSEDYQSWIANYDSTSPDEENLIRESLGTLAEHPKFLVVTLQSKVAGQELPHSYSFNSGTQLYGNFVCAPLPPRSRPSALIRLIEAHECNFVVLLPADALLPNYALAAFVFFINRHPQARVFFADQDIVRDGMRCDPVFKTSFDPIFAPALDSIGIPVAFCTSRISQLATRLIDQPIIAVETLIYEITLLLISGGLDPEICHIPSILAHRTVQGDWSPEDARKVLKRYVVSDQDQAEPCRDHPQWSRIVYAIQAKLPMVSCIIATRDQPLHLQRILDGLLHETAYENLEVIIVDNDTRDIAALSVIEHAAKDRRVRVLVDRGKFNYSRLNNRGAGQANGDILVLLNNDMEIVDRDWLRVLVSYAVRPDIGAVGAKLLYPDGTVQHAGIVLGPDYEIEHKCRFELGSGPSLSPDIALSRCVSAVTGACLALRASVFHEMEGLDEQRFPVAYNDIDLCRRISDHGLKIVYAAEVELIHHESVSRGAAPTIESQAQEHNAELDFWKKHAADYERQDPFYSPNIVYGYGRTMLSCPPRCIRPWAAPQKTTTEPFTY